MTKPLAATTDFPVGEQFMLRCISARWLVPQVEGLRVNGLSHHGINKQNRNISLLSSQEDIELFIFWGVWIGGVVYWGNALHHHL